MLLSRMPFETNWEMDPTASRFVVHALIRNGFARISLSTPSTFSPDRVARHHMKLGTIYCQAIASTNSTEFSFDKIVDFRRLFNVTSGWNDTRSSNRQRNGWLRWREMLSMQRSRIRGRIPSHSTLFTLHSLRFDITSSFVPSNQKCETIWWLNMDVKRSINNCCVLSYFWVCETRQSSNLLGTIYCRNERFKVSFKNYRTCSVLLINVSYNYSTRDRSPVRLSIEKILRSRGHE